MIETIELQNTNETFIEVMSENTKPQRSFNWASFKKTIANDAKKRKEIWARDAERRRQLWARLKSWLTNSKEKSKKQLKPRRQLRDSSTYHVKFTEKEFNRKRKLVNARHRQFSYRCPNDPLASDWQHFLMKLSDRHPIVYNKSLWTTTKSARMRLQKRQQPRKERRCCRMKLQKRLIQNFQLEKLSRNNPHKKVYYSIEKEILVEIHPPSIAQWRLSNKRC